MCCINKGERRNHAWDGFGRVHIPLHCIGIGEQCRHCLAIIDEEDHLRPIPQSCGCCILACISRCILKDNPRNTLGRNNTQKNRSQI